MINYDDGFPFIFRFYSYDTVFIFLIFFRFLFFKEQLKNEWF